MLAPYLRPIVENSVYDCPPIQHDADYLISVLKNTTYSFIDYNEGGVRWFIPVVGLALAYLTCPAIPKDNTLLKSFNKRSFHIEGERLDSAS
jgi:hypothetical protein